MVIRPSSASQNRIPLSWSLDRIPPSWTQDRIPPSFRTPGRNAIDGGRVRPGWGELGVCQRSPAHDAPNGLHRSHFVANTLQYRGNGPTAMCD